MIPLRLGDLARTRLVHGDPETVITGVAIDSRAARRGDLFVALRGARADGHDFVADAASRGAAAACVELGRTPEVELALLEGRDGRFALAAVARAVRTRSAATFVGIAGAAGKTSTKDILGALCAPVAQTVASARSFNNEIGAPLTVCRVERETEVVVCELGTGAPGEVRALASIVRPSIGVITSIGPEHLESFGTVAAAARAEAELIAALPAGGTVVLPASEPLLRPHRRTDLHELTFGEPGAADVSVTSWHTDVAGADVELDVCGRQLRLRTNLRARYHRANVAAAVAAYCALAFSLERLHEGASRVTVSPLRWQERRRRAGGRVLNDAYNANPLSMRAALEALAAEPCGGRRVAVLGEMAELGHRSSEWHRRVGRDAAAVGIDVLIGIGELAREYVTDAGDIAVSWWFPDVEAAERGLPSLLEPGDVVLLKGSRSAALERLEGSAR